MRWTWIGAAVLFGLFACEEREAAVPRDAGRGPADAGAQAGPVAEPVLADAGAQAGPVAEPVRIPMTHNKGVDMAKGTWEKIRERQQRKLRELRSKRKLVPRKPSSPPAGRGPL
ncbi:MAG: hypothetical protein JXR96_03015 [Deltaproteobacteria bacterium]|nr:hypothetical protein [Deltaproteobacteria bacterium]